MSAVVCPTCGATGNQHCSTVRGNDHRKRMLLEIAELEPPRPQCGKCERPSVLPAEYPPECARHYMESVKRAQADAAARFKAKIAALTKGRAS